MQIKKSDLVYVLAKDGKIAKKVAALNNWEALKHTEVFTK